MKKLIIVATFLSIANAANILGVFLFPSQSHHVLGSILMENLAKRGHNVTYISPFKMKEVPNVTTLVIDELLVYKEEELQKYFREGTTLLDHIGKVKAIINLQYVFMESPKMQWFLKSDSKYDVMIHFMGTDASLGLAHHFDVPIIVFTPVGGLSLIGNRFGNPNPTAYVPSAFLPYSDDMNFCERLMNTIVELLFNAIMPVIKYCINEAIKEYFPGAPPLAEIENRVQMGFINSHISTETPRPYVPAMVQIGGFHLQEPEPLSKNLKKVLDEATNGIIYFSFGTNVKISELPKDKLSIMLTSLGKTPMKVLLKSDKDTLVNKPNNVEISSWFPQRGILSHPNVKLFISHGGYGGAAETLFYGVPMICMPFFADQHMNCATAERDGYGINLPTDQLTPEKFDGALQKVLYDKTFKANAKLKSELYRDQEMNPMDKAGYWVNHVVKHKGAKHLRVKALNLVWYQYYLLDVIGFISLVTLVASTILFYILKCCLKVVCRRQQKIKTN